MSLFATPRNTAVKSPFLSSEDEGFFFFYWGGGAPKPQDLSPHFQLLKKQGLIF